MIYDPKRRRYVEKGRVLTPKEVRQHVEDYISHQQAEVDSKSKNVLLGTITLAAFFEFMREKIQAWHSIAGVIAYGGQGQMNLERWQWINEKVQSELRYLNNFQVVAERGYRKTREVASEIANAVEKDATVPAGLEAVVEREVQAAITASDAAGRTAAVEDAIQTALADSIGTTEAETVAARVAKDVLESQQLDEVIWGQIGSRGRMYADSLYGTYENSVKAREGDAGVMGVRRISENDSHSCDECPALAVEEYVPLDEITDIGDAECMSNCRCTLEFDYAGVEPLAIDREVYA